MAHTMKAGFILLVVSLVVSQPARAQKAVRQAPTPAEWAALAKLPDFTGVWEVGLGGGTPRAAGRGAQGSRPPGQAGGRGGPLRPAPPALTPEYAAKAQALAKRKAPEESQTANCLPPGLPAIMNQPYPIEILLTPGQVTIVSEAYTQVRHIYTDGRPLPADPDPTFYGSSVGHWENDTLVVETIGFAQVPRGIPFPYSDKLKIVERFRLTDPNMLTLETTLLDPEALTKPYSMGTRTFRRHRSWTIAEYICEENNRNFADQNGKAGVNLANPDASPR